MNLKTSFNKLIVGSALVASLAFGLYHELSTEDKKLQDNKKGNSKSESLITKREMVCNFLAEEMEKASPKIFDKYHFSANARNKEALKAGLLQIYQGANTQDFDKKFDEFLSCANSKRREELRDLALYMLYYKQSQNQNDAPTPTNTK